MQDMSFSSPKYHDKFCYKILLILLVFLGTCLGQCRVLAFEFDLPSTIILCEPFTVGYRMKLDGSDELRWMVNITDINGQNPETLNNGQIFQTVGFQGTIQVTINRPGIFLLKAVNPDFPAQTYATSIPNIAWETEEDPEDLPDDPDDGSPGSEGGNGGGQGDNEGGNAGGGGGTGNDDGPEDGTGGGDGDGNEDEDGNGSDPDDTEDSGDNSGTSPTVTPRSSPSIPSPSPDPNPSTPRSSPSPSVPAARSGITNNSRTGLIAGLVTAGIILFILILAALFFCRRRKRSGETGRKTKRPLTFYRDRMIRGPTPPPATVAPLSYSVDSEPIPNLMNPDTQLSYAGIGSGGGYGPGPSAYPYAPKSASTSVQPGMREFMLSPRGPRPPGSASATGPQLKEFILRSPRSTVPMSPSYSKP